GGVQRLLGFLQEPRTRRLDETYHLNMRAYTIYVLATAGNPTGEVSQEAAALVGQVPRMSTHARAWLAIALSELGQNADSKSVLDSLAASARQSSTTARWEESTP